MVELTKEQIQALHTRDVSIALSAGAGCGKTFVLTERFLSHLDPSFPGNQRSCQWHELVAITFTEKAAREMRDRIRKTCEQRIAQMASTKEGDRWWHLLEEMDAARISTIHAFCTELLKAHAVEAGLDPSFSVLDAAQSRSLLSSTIDEEFRRWLSRKDPHFIELAAGFEIHGLRERVQQWASLRGKPGFDGWRDAAPDELVNHWTACRDELLIPETLSILASEPSLQRLLDLFDRHPLPDHAEMCQRIDVIRRHATRLEEGSYSVGEIAELRAAAKVQGCLAGRWESPDLYEAVKQDITRLRNVIDHLPPCGSLDNVTLTVETARVTSQLFNMCHHVLEAYERRKTAAAALDFDDLILRTRDLLIRSEPLRKAVASQIRLLMVDEFQDTDEAQVDLVWALADDPSRQGNLFVVGDFKQSIYRFRGAQPEVFTRLSEQLPEGGRLRLTTNFRSQPAILNFANALFCDALKSPDQSFDRLRPARGAVTGEPCIEFLWAGAEAESEHDPSQDPKSATEERSDSADQRRAREADWIARRILQMIDRGEEIVVDKESGRPRAVRPGDVAILFRALTGVAAYEQALERHAVDYYLVGGRAFYAQQEVYDVLSLLRAIDCPGDEVSLVGVLRSPFFALEDETLFWLSQHPNGLGGGLFGELPEELSPAQHHQATFAAKTLGELREIKDFVPVAELLQIALDRTGYDAALLGEFLGERKLANLQKLVQEARSFDRGGMFTLADFVAELTESIAEQPHEEPASTTAAEADVVKLMTVHKAKGLEFPVVFLVDVDSTTQSSRATAAYDLRVGPVTAIPEIAGGDKSCGGFPIWAWLEKRENEQELTRLFYVAVTRAADFLVLSCGRAPNESGRGPWQKLLGERFDLETGRLKVELPNDYPLPHVRVVDQRPDVEDPAGGSRGPSIQRVIEEVKALAEQSATRIDLPELVREVPLDATARQEFSVSAITGKLESNDPDESFQSNERRTAPDRDEALLLGMLVHDLLATSPWSKPSELQAKAQFYGAEMNVPTELVTEAERLVETFCETPRAQSLGTADRVFAELEFLLNWPPKTRQSNGPYFRGYIDCLYHDADGWHLLDYKTNRLQPETLSDVSAAYELQLYVYSLAIEASIGERLSEIALHFLRGNLEYCFEFTEADRQRLAAQVEMGLTQTVPD